MLQPIAKPFIISSVKMINDIEFSDLITPDDAADMLGIKRRSVYQYRRTGRIEGVYFGRALMISKSSVEKWLTGQRATKEIRERNKASRKKRKRNKKSAP